MHSNKRKICIIGDSHCASIKNAYDIKKSLKEFDLNFYAARGDLFKNIYLDNNHLKSNNNKLTESIRYTSKYDSIDLNRYDVFLVYGLGFNFNVLMYDAIFRSQQVNYLRVENLIRYSLFGKIFKLLKNDGNKKIYLGHNPLETTKNNKYSKDDKYSYCNWFKIVNDFFQEHYSSVTLIQQPKITILDDRYTKQEYSLGSKRLDIGDNISNDEHPVEDLVHMNDKFGELWLQEFFEKLMINSN